MKFDFKICKHEYELFGVKLFIKEWTLRQRLEVQGMAGKEVEDVKDRYNELIWECVSDENGDQVKEEDLLDLPFSEVDKLIKEVNRINGIDLKKAEELAKNSEAIRVKFLFKLAAHLNMTQQELLDRMSWQEFNFWIAREQVDPIPDNWLQWRWIMAALTRGEKDTKLKPEKFDFNFSSKSSDNGRAIFEALALKKHKEKDGKSR
ncbi:MAG: hypothetical protein R3C17_10575 [Planctomycetaceae bacterium]